MKTYSIAEVAELLCGNDLKHPDLWVLRRIYEGRFRALQIGKVYRMTEEHIADAMASLEVKRAPKTPQYAGLTATAARRRRA
jgi:hypothetical protein